MSDCVIVLDPIVISGVVIGAPIILPPPILVHDPIIFSLVMDIGIPVVVLTQAAYNALAPPTPGTLYLIVG